MRSFLWCMVVVLVASSTAMAAPTLFNVSLNGSNEVGGGDVDGAASGTITFDPTPGVYGTISWNLTYSNIATPLTGFHIHTGAAGVNGGILVPLRHDQPSDSSGTLIFSYNDSNWAGEWDKAKINQILENPPGFYLNIHNNDFPNGAVRGQIPEPASLGLVLLGGGIGLLRRRRV